MEKSMENEMIIENEKSMENEMKDGLIIEMGNMLLNRCIEHDLKSNEAISAVMTAAGSCVMSIFASIGAKDPVGKYVEVLKFTVKSTEEEKQKLNDAFGKAAEEEAMKEAEEEAMKEAEDDNEVKEGYGKGDS